MTFRADSPPTDEPRFPRIKRTLVDRPYGPPALRLAVGPHLRGSVAQRAGGQRGVPFRAEALGRELGSFDTEREAEIAVADVLRAAARETVAAAGDPSASSAALVGALRDYIERAWCYDAEATGSEVDAAVNETLAGVRAILDGPHPAPGAARE